MSLSEASVLPMKSNITGTSGYIELIIGPMYSGKTSRLISVYRQSLLCNVNCLTINYAEDTRYSHSQLSSHDQIMVPCHFAGTISEIIKDTKHSEEYKKAEVILINEGQFFPDLKETVLKMVDKDNKRVYVCGLDGDFRRRSFGQILELVPHADSVLKLKSLCVICKNGTPALFSHRINQSNKEVKVIGSDAYLPLCRKCYNNQSDSSDS